MVIVHTTVATKADEAGAEVNKAEWNDDHEIGSTSIVPNTDSTTNLGALTLRFATLHVDEILGATMTSDTISDYDGSLFLPLTGGTMSGGILMSTNDISNILTMTIGKATATRGVFDVVGEIDSLFTADAADQHGYELDLDAAGFGDVKELDIDYITGALGLGEEEGVVLVNIDESGASSGEVFGLEILSTNVSTNTVKIALKTGIAISPISHSSGVFTDADSILNNTTSVITELSSGGAGNISAFIADDDIIVIGDAAKFEEIEVILDTPASGGGVAPTFEFSIGVGSWTAFTPTDGTNGFKNTGVILFDEADIPSWIAGAGSEFLIRITRTRNTVTVTPILDLIQIAAVTIFSWDSTGVISPFGVDLNTGYIYSGSATGMSIDGASNTITNIGAAEIEADIIAGLGINSTPAASDTIMMLDSGALKEVSMEVMTFTSNQISDLPSLSSVTETFEVPCVMEVPEGTTAFPDIHPLATAGSKISGFVFPDGTATGTVNFKSQIKIPDQLAGTPALKVRMTWMPLGTVAGNATLAVRTLVSEVADTENYDLAYDADTIQGVQMPATLEFQDVFERTVTSSISIVAGDHVVGQIERFPANGTDTFTDDVMLVSVSLLVDRSIS